MGNHPTWKKREQQVMAFFGSTRKPVSGRQRDKDGDDGEHPVIHVQQKHSKRHAIVKLWDQAQKQALKADKVPIVTLTVEGRPGFWILLKMSDLEAIAHQRNEFAEAVMEQVLQKSIIEGGES